MTKRRAGRCPETDCAVDVEPRAGCRRRVCSSVEVVEGAGVDVAGLDTDDRRPVCPAELVPERFHDHPALLVGRNLMDGGSADSEEPQRPVERRVSILPGDHADQRRAVQAVTLYIPSNTGKEVVTGRGETGEVSHLPAGDESERGALGQAEQLLQPSSGDLLDDSRRGRRERQTGVLIPGRREPVGRDCRRNGPADDEAEEPSARRGQQARIGVASKLLDDLERVRGLLWQGTAKRGPQLVDRCLGPHRSLFERVEELGCDLRRAPQQIVRAHARTQSSAASSTRNLPGAR